ncbi:hypothetical protein [Actinophytocola oryzae]|nr:hypothetical protein [Actinophytocola oryzae]
MSNVLMVPVHLDALYCPCDRTVVGGSVEFDRLPFTDGTADVNCDVAQISEEIVARPFQDATAVLRAGVHLHWSLPDALTHGHHRQDSRGADTGYRTDFPAVPTRWLVRRRFSGAGDAPLPTRSWVVESDYLHPDGTGATVGVAVPVAPGPGRHRPFRYLGRTVPKELWTEEDPAAEYVSPLTAVGFERGTDEYSDPVFAALYPNCHSVFGFHDPEISGPLPAGLRYDLLGWYADAGQDFLRTVADSAALESEAAWTITPTWTGDLPTMLTCYASLGFTTPAPPPGERTVVSVGNTGTEALSVALAARLDPANRFAVEDQLEGIQLAPRLARHTLDVGARFRALRHEKGFTAHRGDVRWTISPSGVSAVPRPADVGRAQAQAEVPLPPELADLLAALNDAQQTRDRAATELESARRQLFADWYKYQLCAYPPDATGAYPDVDEARAFLETEDLPLVSALAAAVEPGPGTPEDRLRAAHTAATVALDRLNDSAPLRAAGLRYELKPVVAPRFWQPTDPVVLFTGDDAVAVDRHGRDGRLRADDRLACHVLPWDLLKDVLADDQRAFDLLVNSLREFEDGQDGSVAFRDSDGAPWNPIELEWEVAVSPVREQGNLHPETDSYDPGFITTNYTLTGQDPDLVESGASPAVAGAVAVYSGATYLTWHAGERLRQAITDFLREEILPEFLAATGGDPATDPAAVLDDLLVWYRSSRGTELDTPAERAADAGHVAIRALQELRGMNYLAQSLGGFNDALLMHRTTRQLPIADPLGFDDDRALAATVAAAVGTGNRSAPLPLNDFAPIRGGVLRLRRLRLVDTFGQVRDVPVDDALAAETMTTPGNPELVRLAPRLSQPARLVFRWLAADADIETTEHPDTSPICGWFSPDHLDAGLAVHDASGRALGTIEPPAVWRPAPGGTGAATVAGIVNDTLRRTVAAILRLGADFLTQLMSAVDGALDNIEPAAADQHVDLAVLVGRPLALVRAALDLEVLGMPAVHQGWNQFRQDMARTTRDTDGFTRVAFPVRLGAYRQLDDGLIGYWRDGEDTFYSPQSDGFDHPAIRTYADGPLFVAHAVDDPSQVLRMLVDPRGTVHVTAGIQPVKAITIPPAHYAPALGRIEVAFPCGPVLTDPTELDLPLPVEPGYRWGWTGGGLRETSQAPTIHRDVFVDALASRLWAHLVDPHVAWLRQVPGASGRIRAVPPAQRVSAELGAPFLAMTAGVEQVLAPLGDTILERLATVDRLAATVGRPVWDALLEPETGWLAPVDGDSARARVVAKDSRARQALAAGLAGTEPLVESIVDLGATRIGPVTTAVTFAAGQELRGGRLTLRADESA